MQPELFLAGSYNDQHHRGAKVLESFLSMMHLCFEDRVSLRLLCCGSANTRDDGQPRTLCLRYNLTTDRATCCRCDSPGALLCLCVLLFVLLLS